jgi:predicted esterase
VLFLISEIDNHSVYLNKTQLHINYFNTLIKKSLKNKKAIINIQTNYFQTQKTARFSTYGELTSETKYFWFVLHGSKMTCEQMLYKFAEFNPKEHFVVAPEALNRFYANGFGGDVVASWMTKRDRLEEINDFSTYLQKLYQKYLGDLPKSCTKIILGFSQGGTTMYRWLHAMPTEADFLIPYSCWIPEDIDLRKSATQLNQIKTYYTYGIQDQFLSAETISKVQEVINKNYLDITFYPYDGDHRVSKEQLKFLFEKIQ